MTGVVLALLGAESAGGGGGAVIVPGPLVWNNIFGSGAGVSNNQTLTLITVPIVLNVSTFTGGGVLHFIKNGVAAAYSGGVSVVAGDVIAWYVVNPSPIHTQSGTITIENATDGGAVLDSFTYVVNP